MSRVLELAQKAATLYSAQDREEKRKLVQLTHSNSIWNDGELVPNLKKPSDSLALRNEEYRRKKAVSLAENGLSEIWLPNPDSNQGQGG
ncbi:MAG: hypothetical protein HYS23_12795 [Geobacter sp.]|nr:hypothetical protein [Geobacter sp.]